MSPYRILTAIAIFCMVLGVTMFSTSCRDKDNPPPDTTDGPTGDWRIVLLPPLALYRDSPGGHVPNDTIPIRVFNNNGQITANATVICQCLISVDSISAAPLFGGVSSSSDTVHAPWGCQPALFYWGAGDPEAPERVTCWVIGPAPARDTLATTVVNFFVYDPPGILPADTSAAALK